jgi:dTDP-4-dehydrorhamnose reductase
MALSRAHWPILVTGAGGLLGTALSRRLADLAPSPDALWLTDLRPRGAPSGPPIRTSPAASAAASRTTLLGLDVTDAEAVARTVAETRPRTVFHLAAWTDVDGAEREPDAARRTNVLGSEHVARAAADAGARLVALGTDFVFDGAKRGAYTEADPPAPLSVYGRTKAEAEDRVRDACPEGHLIARAAWLYGGGGANFVDAVLDRARAGETLRVVTDQAGCPTWTEDLAAALVDLVEAEARGTYHVCGEGEASRWDLAAAALEAAGLDARPEAIVTSDLPSRVGGSPRAPRPARAVLSTEKLAATLGRRLPPWRDSVRTYVAENNGRSLSPP